MKCKPFFLLFIFFFFFHTQIFAIYDPLTVPNNTFGIHVADTNDMTETSKLINSTHGDWGYVTVVMEERDRNQGKWQKIFNDMRRLHLIPIIRLATHVDKDAWVKPEEVDASKWADFLGSLNWPVENRYIILFNEPNHKKEWGNTIDPEGFARLSYVYAKKLKETSQDFFILPGGLDSAASSDGDALDAENFLQRMYKEKPELFSIIDGWTSHSYPNPAFSGSPTAVGKGTIQSFLWELQFLRSLGVTKKLPVFITETGWVHMEGKILDARYLTSEQVGNYMTIASKNVWNNSQIVALTPFVYSYQDIPFDHFSWKKMGVSEFYPQYQAYQSIQKIKGQPKQRESFETIPPLFPDLLVTNSTYTLTTELKNTGQSIVSERYTVAFDAGQSNITSIPEPVPYIEPEGKGIIILHIKTPPEEGEYEVNLFMEHDNKKILIEKKKIRIIPPPNISLDVTFGWTENKEADNSTILIYDQKDVLLHKFPNLTIKNGGVTVTGLYNMIPGNKYRVVLVTPYYLPRQTLITLSSETTTVHMKRLLPFDFNNDGALSLDDIRALLFTQPREVFGRFF